MDRFLIQHNSKSNFKNTWNDILILSKAINKQLPLLTEDKLLNRFAAENYDIKAIGQDGFLKIDFSDSNHFDKKQIKKAKDILTEDGNIK